MHSQQKDFVKGIFIFGKDFKTNDILELGSFNVNGSIRDFEVFKESNHIGCDLTDGPGVDIVYDGVNLDLDRKFDITISCEVFEHDPHFISTFQSLINYKAPRGIVIFTCASRGRGEHGTQRTNPNDSPGTSAVGIDYYRNVNKRDIQKKINLKDYFDNHFFHYHKSSNDLYFFGETGYHYSKSEILALKKNVIQFIEMREDIMPLKPNILSYLDFLPRLILSYYDDLRYQNYMILRTKISQKIKSFFSL